MTTSAFAAMKKDNASSLENLTSELTKMNTGFDNGPDEREWKASVDSAGNGMAVIRFLPAPVNEDIPFVRMYTHGFQGPTGMWYIENSLTTLNQDDPVSEYNSMLWKSGIEANKKLVSDHYKRRLSYWSNIYVVTDTAHPENEGKVFLYRYGAKIWDKLNDLMNPEFEDETPTNPFDLWEGATFKLKIRKVDGYRNYDKSEFIEAAPLLDDDDKLEAIWNAEYPLKEIVAEDKFKPAAELKAKLYKVLNLDQATDVVAPTAPAEALKAVSEPVVSETAAAASEPIVASAEDEVAEDETLAFFDDLAAETTN
tara:strand:- start:6270 stop:7202 length:933 start_codon:yes stop_codon:yes gene_type:complete